VAGEVVRPAAGQDGVPGVDVEGERQQLAGAVAGGADAEARDAVLVGGGGGHPHVEAVHAHGAGEEQGQRVVAGVVAVDDALHRVGDGAGAGHGPHHGVAVVLGVGQVAADDVAVGAVVVVVPQAEGDAAAFVLVGERLGLGAGVRHGRVRGRGLVG